ncbi:reverse transcriptase [Senna tora]|uniref:Reverse transcriptase n=1 Tax=Senna tora TaxID=362788 RepID=A0A834TIM3_9FABA|nr:reverse transcriptase [Senna tora]
MSIPSPNPSSPSSARTAHPFKEPPNRSKSFKEILCGNIITPTSSLLNPFLPKNPPEFAMFSEIPKSINLIQTNLTINSQAPLLPTPEISLPMELVRKIKLPEDIQTSIFNKWKTSIIIQMPFEAHDKDSLSIRLKKLWRIQQSPNLHALGQNFFMVADLLQDDRLRILTNQWFLGPSPILTNSPPTSFTKPIHHSNKGKTSLPETGITSSSSERTALPAPVTSSQINEPPQSKEAATQNPTTPLISSSPSPAKNTIPTININDQDLDLIETNLVKECSSSEQTHTSRNHDTLHIYPASLICNPVSIVKSLKNNAYISSPPSIIDPPQNDNLLPPSISSSSPKTKNETISECQPPPNSDSTRTSSTGPTKSTSPTTPLPLPSISPRPHHASNSYQTPRGWQRYRDSHPPPQDQREIFLNALYNTYLTYPSHHSGLTLIWLNLLRGILNNSSWLHFWVQMMNEAYVTSSQPDLAQEHADLNERHLYIVPPPRFRRTDLSYNWFPIHPLPQNLSLNETARPPIPSTIFLPPTAVAYTLSCLRFETRTLNYQLKLTPSEPDAHPSFSQASSSLASNPCPTPNMKILAWNVRGAANPEFRRVFRDMMPTYQPDMVLLTETRISGEHAENIIASLGFDNTFKVDAMGFAGGIWILWNPRAINVDILSFSFQEIQCLIKASCPS